MDICYATDYLPGYHKLWGGAEQACYRLAKLLIKKRHHVSLLASQPLKRPEEDFDFLSIPVLENLFPERMRYPLRQLKLVLWPFDFISAVFSYRALRKTRPDILHLHNIVSLSFALVWAARRLKIPTVYSLYDYAAICPMGHLWVLKDYADYQGTPCRQFHGSHCVHCLTSYRKLGPVSRLLLTGLLSLRRKNFDFFLKRIDGFVVLSESNARVLEEYGIAKEKISVIPIPLSEEIQAAPVEEKSILYVGWLQPRKGPHIILEAMPQILARVPDAKLYLIGELRANQAYEERIANLVNQKGLEGHVFMLGRKPYSEVREFMRKAHVVVIPEQWETIPPNALTEGMVYGKAIIASNIGGTLDYITDGENGLLAEAHSPADFADKIVSLLKDEKLASRLGQKAREAALGFFSEESVYQRLLNIYEPLVKKRAGGAP